MPDNNLRIKITRDIAQKITEIGRKYKLKLVVIYGNRLEYHNFKAYAFRAYMDSKDLLQIEKILSQKTISYLRQLHG